MVEDDLFLSDRLSVEHIRLLFPGLHADDDISKLFSKLNDCCLCDDSDIPGSYPIEGAPALWLKVLSQPKCEKIQALKKAFICSIEKSLLEHDYAESQTKKSSPGIQLSLSGLEDDSEAIQTTTEIDDEQTDDTPDVTQEVEPSKESSVNCESRSEKPHEISTAQSEDEIDSKECELKQEEVADKEIAIEKSIAEETNTNDYNSDLGSIENSDTVEAHDSNTGLSNIESNVICEGTVEERDAMNKNSEEISVEIDRNVANIPSYAPLPRAISAENETCARAQGDNDEDGLSEVGDANDDDDVSEDEENEDTEEYSGAIIGTSQELENKSGVSIPIAAPSQTTLSLGSLDDTPSDISLSVKKEVVDNSYDEAWKTLTNPQHALPTAETGATDMNLQISNVESSVAEPFYPALDERDGAPSGHQALNAIASHHQPNSSQQSSVVPHTSNRDQAAITEPDDPSPTTYPSRQRGPYGVAQGVGQCKQKYMSCYLKDIKKHRMTAHPPGTKFVMDKDLCRKLLKQDLRNGGKSMDKKDKTDDNLRLYYCCDCEKIHDSLKVDYFVCRIDNAVSSCEYSFVACTRTAVDAHRIRDHGAKCNRFRTRKLKYAKMDNNPKRPRNLPTKENAAAPVTTSYQQKTHNVTHNFFDDEPSKGSAATPSNSKYEAAEPKQEKKPYDPANVLTCTHCNLFACESKAELNDHLVTSHPDVPPEICEDCGKVLGTEHTVDHQCLWSGCKFKTCSQEVFDTHVLLSAHKVAYSKDSGEIEKPTTRDLEYQRKLMEKALEKFDSSQWDFSCPPFKIFWPTTIECVDGYYKCPLCDFRSKYGYRSLKSHATKHFVGPFKVRFSQLLFDTAKPDGSSSSDSRAAKERILIHRSCDGDCPAKALLPDSFINAEIQSHLESCHMHNTEKPLDDIEFFCCPFCKYMQASENRQNLYSHIHEHGTLCQLCFKVLSSTHMYGCAIRKQDGKHYVICSNHRQMTHEIIIKKYKVDQKIKTIQEFPGPIPESVANIEPEPPKPTVDDLSEPTMPALDPSIQIKSEPMDVSDNTQAQQNCDYQVRRSARLTTTPRVNHAPVKKVSQKEVPTVVNSAIEPTATMMASEHFGPLDGINFRAEPEDLDSGAESADSESSASTENANPMVDFFAITDAKNPYQCYFCSFATDEDLKMAEHLLAAHVDDNHYTCKLCVRGTQFRASRRANWSAHMATAHGICTHMLEPGKTDHTSHSLDTNQMLELAGDDDIAPCASCAFKQAENRQDFKRKRVRSVKHKRKAKRQKRDRKLAVSGGVKGSRDSDCEGQETDDNDDSENNSEADSDDEAESVEQSESEEAESEDSSSSSDDDASDYEIEEPRLKRGRPRKYPNLSPTKKSSVSKVSGVPRIVNIGNATTVSKSKPMIRVIPRAKPNILVKNPDTPNSNAKHVPQFDARAMTLDASPMISVNGNYYIKSADGKIFRLLPQQPERIPVKSIVKKDSESAQTVSAMLRHKTAATGQSNPTSGVQMTNNASQILTNAAKFVTSTSKSDIPTFKVLPANSSTSMSVPHTAPKAPTIKTIPNQSLPVVTLAAPQAGQPAPQQVFILSPNSGGALSIVQKSDIAIPIVSKNSSSTRVVPSVSPGQLTGTHVVNLISGNGTTTNYKVPFFGRNTGSQAPSPLVNVKIVPPTPSQAVSLITSSATAMTAPPLSVKEMLSAKIKSSSEQKTSSAHQQPSILSVPVQKSGAVPQVSRLTQPLNQSFKMLSKYANSDDRQKTSSAQQQPSIQTVPEQKSGIAPQVSKLTQPLNKSFKMLSKYANSDVGKPDIDTPPARLADMPEYYEGLESSNKEKKAPRATPVYSDDEEEVSVPKEDFITCE